MTRNASVTSINCTSCGAGLDVLGGGRVQTHVCGYCGSQLDVQDDYKVLQQFADLERPDSPFRIGMKGKVRGVEYTVIGTLGHEERYAGRVWRWVDHQLFSPTHGYAFLTVEKGHFIFSRAYRKATNPLWISAASLETMDVPPTVTADLDRYRYYDTSNSYITFVEGEFNWQPKIGDQSEVVSLMSQDAVLAFSKTATEEEIIRSTYPDQLEIATSFGLESLPRLEGVHRLQPYLPSPHKAFLQKTLGIAAVVCLLLYVGVLLFGRGSEAASFRVTDSPAAVSFDITQPNRIARVELTADIRNSWVYYDIDVEGPDDETAFETGRTISYYTGSDWTEGSRSASLRFRPNAAGAHTLNIDLSEAESRGMLPPLTVRVTEGGMVAKWFLFAGLFFLLAWVIASVRAGSHYKARWRGWDWND